MQLPLALLDGSVIEEVSLDVWREVFAVTGWPPSLSGKRDSFGYDDLITSLGQDEPTDSLLQVLETLQTLGTDTGREAIVAAMNDRRIPLNTLPQGTGEREFALRLYFAQRSNASLADVFARAQTQVQEESDQRRYNEFAGKEARDVTNLSAKKQKLRDEILRHCSANDLGEHVQLQAFEDDGAYVFNILRSHRIRQPLAIIQGREARATIQYRPVHGDILRYEASVLQQRGRASLENHGIFGVGRVWMTECLWERGDRNLLHIRSSDCFRSIEELRLQLTEGELLQAKLKLEVIGKSTRPVTVNIRVPSRIEVSQKIHEHLVERVLNAVGIRNVSSSSRGIDLWSLHPWRHPLAAWRSVFGAAEADALAKEGVLISIRLDSAPASEHPDAGRTLRAHPLSEGEFYGVSDVDEIPSRSLSATDLDGLELNPEKFRLYLRSRPGITSGGVTWDGTELLEPGFIEVGDHRLYTVYALRKPQPGIGERIRAHAGPAHAVFLIPSAEPHTSELATVVLDAALPTRAQTIRCAINACGLGNSVPAIYCAPEGARLVVDTRSRQVWIDGIEIGGLKPDSHPFRLIEFMARKQRASTEEISAELSRARQDGDTTARQAKNAAKRAIIEAMAKAGRAFDEDLFPSGGTGFYRCALPAFVQ